jgi:hypothetical protein
MFSRLKLGLKPHDPESVARVCKLTPSMAALDPLVSRTPKDWALGRAWDDDILGNDVWGDCAPVTAVNWLKMMAAAARSDLSFDVDDVLDAYRALGWKGTAATDNGVVLLDLMDYWCAFPIGGVQIDCFFRIGFGDPEHLATAIQIAPLIVGATLTTECKGSDTWGESEAAGAQVWGDHAYLYHADSPGAGIGKSWGAPVYTTPPFRSRRWNEAYLPICRELMPGRDVDRLIKIAWGL